MFATRFNRGFKTLDYNYKYKQINYSDCAEGPNAVLRFLFFQVF